MKAKGDRTGIGQLSFLRVPLIMFVAAAASGQNREVWYRLSLSAAKAKDNGDFLQAKELAEAALTEARKFPQGDIRIADSLATLGATLIDLDRADQATPVLEEALAATDHTQPEIYVAILHSLAACRFILGHHEETDALLQQALELAKRTWGDRDWRFAVCMSEVGLLHMHMDRYADAERLFRSAAAIQQRLPQERARLARTLTNLADAYRMEGNLLEAHELLRKALRILSETNPAGLQTAFVQRSLALVFAQAGELDRASDAFRRAQAELEAKLPSDHRSRAAIALQMAAVERRRSRLAAAEQIVTDSLHRLEANPGAPVDLIADHRLELAEIYLRRKRYTDTLAIANGQLELMAGTQGKSPHQELTYRRQIAETHFGLQDYATADRMFREIESGMANTFARSDVVFADIWERHARVLQKLGQGDEAKSLRNRASKLVWIRFTASYRSSCGSFRVDSVPEMIPEV